MYMYKYLFAFTYMYMYMYMYVHVKIVYTVKLYNNDESNIHSIVADLYSCEG